MRRDTKELVRQRIAIVVIRSRIAEQRMIEDVERLHAEQQVQLLVDGERTAQGKCLPARRRSHATALRCRLPCVFRSTVPSASIGVANALALMTR